jgi:hypothetical protein
MAETVTKSDAPVAARAAVDQGDTSAGLEERAREQEKRQAAELRAGQSGKPKGGKNVADNRAPAGYGGRGVQGGFVDQMTRRDATDALEGHFVTVDRTHSDLTDDAKQALPEGLDGFGVYLEPASTDGDGYPVTAIVLLRDRSNARVVVPYAALRPVPADHRR